MTSIVTWIHVIVYTVPMFALVLISLDWVKAGKGEVITAALDKEMDDYHQAAKAQQATTA